MLADLHVHSKYSQDAQPHTIEELAQSAEDKGFSFVAICDHKDFFRAKEPEYYDVAACQRDIAAANERHNVTLLRGIELGEIHATPDTMDFLSRHTFDQVIGSLHSLPDDRDFYQIDFTKEDCETFLREYLLDLNRMVLHGGFDILAHIDFPLRVMRQPSFYPSFQNYMEWVSPVLKNIIERDIALELNAAMLFSWRQEPGPEPCVLEEYRRLGGELITFGSDSHSKDNLGRGIQDEMAYAKTFGFTHMTVFQNRKPQQFSI